VRTRIPPLRGARSGSVYSRATSDAARAELRTVEELRAGIAGFYDSSSGVWEKVWGEHMHHGFYDDSRKDHVQAQVDMIDKVLEWSGADDAPPTSVLDVGCGIGGSSRHIARKYGSSGIGITLSPVQAARAQQLSNDQGLGEALSFEVADALHMPFADNSFDLIWSMESGEHMPDKQQFVSELARVCKPGGRVIVVAWCHRDLEPGEQALAMREERLLRTINRAYFLPRWCSVADYMRYASEQGLSEIKRDDWTDKVKRFWPAVILSALRPRAFVGLLRSGTKTIRGALVMPLMIRGQRRGLVKFGLWTGRKTSSPSSLPSPVSPTPLSMLVPPPSAPPVPSSPIAVTGAAAPDGFKWGGTF